MKEQSPAAQLAAVRWPVDMMRLGFIFIAFSIIIVSCQSNGEATPRLSSPSSNIEETPFQGLPPVIQSTQAPNTEGDFLPILEVTSTQESTRTPSTPTPINLETFEWDILPPLSEALLVPSELDIAGNLSIRFALEGGATVYKRRFDLEDRCSFDCVHSFWETPYKHITIRMFRLLNRESAKADMLTTFDVFGPAFIEYSDLLYNKFERSDAWMIISNDHEFVSARRYGAIVVIVSAKPDGRTDDSVTEAMAVGELSNEQIRKLEFLGFPQ